MLEGQDFSSIEKYVHTQGEDKGRLKKHRSC